MIINGKDYTPFEDYKNATQLGIDKSRKFIVLRVGGNFNAGDIVTLQRDDNTTAPFFERVSDGNINCKYWDGLAYYDEPKFKVGDKVRIVKCVDERGQNDSCNWDSEMDKYINVETTITKICTYKKNRFKLEDTPDYIWTSDWLVKLEKDNCGIVRIAGDDGRCVIGGWDLGVDLSIDNKLTKPTGNKFMSIISNTFKSKENKALEHFSLGSSCELNERGLLEFLRFQFETNKELREAFLAKLVDAHKEEKE